MDVANKVEERSGYSRRYLPGGLWAGDGPMTGAATVYTAGLLVARSHRYCVAWVSQWTVRE